MGYGMSEKRYLVDGTPVEVIRTQIGASGLYEAQIKPVDKEAFESGVNPWIMECYLLSKPPYAESENNDQDVT